ncbi:hypothetical protein B0H10DRAFT_2215377 [Mycena sp. CBHHK59/15]|nr:hypothetical protein B0H10DRAFT_2215377 [Mycena sp. CBHHK59/15]
MVSTLWKACSQGDLESVQEALANASSVDIEIKDHTGVTPLIEAIRNGHAEVVKVLLDKGADPTNGSSQATPEQYTTDQTIIGMLNFARSKMPQGPASPHANGYDTNENTYTQPPPGNYPYYPSINSAPPPEMYYPPPPPQMHMENNGSRHNNLPPPEVASAIPCRYFPACRSPSPPAQYPTSYEQMPPQAYAPTYYPVSPPSFQPPMNGQHPMGSLPPPQGPSMAMHAQSPSEMMPPPQGHFSPNGAPAMPYGPISPMMSPMYSHSGQAPLPMSIPPLPLPPLHHPPPPPPAPQAPQATFNPSSPPSAPPSTFVIQQNPAQYSPANGNGPISYPEANGGTPKTPQLNPQPETSGPGREGQGANRRGTARRGSFANRKQTPACIFFPSGRCKNGAECRFPHVISPDGPNGHAPYYPARGGGPRSRGHMNGNGFGAIDEKLANMSIQDGSRNQNGTDGSRSQSMDPAARARGAPGGKNLNGQTNKRASVVKQRVPNADEFPVLTGSTTPPARSPGVNGALPNGNGHVGPTAAQILQAPRPTRGNTSQAITSRGVTPERVKPEVNGVDVHPSPKIPSFASVATASSDVSAAA